MNSQDFLILNSVAGGAFLIWYLVSRGGPQKPTALDLKAKDSAPPLINSKEVRMSVRGDESKNLNVIFNYNGHSWDAYEVLGVPAGASIGVVTEAYQSCIRRCEKDSVEFFEAAYRAILNRKY